jgi:hypothetical protein
MNGAHKRAASAWEGPALAYAKKRRTAEVKIGVLAQFEEPGGDLEQRERGEPGQVRSVSTCFAAL